MNVHVCMTKECAHTEVTDLILNCPIIVLMKIEKESQLTNVDSMWKSWRMVKNQFFFYKWIWIDMVIVFDR